MLKVEQLNVYYGVIHALKNISFEVSKGQIVTLIGSNGAGKSTILKTLSNLIKPSSGNVFFEEESTLDVAPHRLVEMGISHVPEGRRVFPELTVMENLEMGAYARKDKDEVNKDYEEVFKRFPRLLERKTQLAGTLSGGEQQMLAMSRALMSRPKILLLDEPSMGLAPLLVDEIFKIIESINKTGTTILLVEQNATRALNIAHYGYVLEVGHIILEGKASDLLVNPKVIEAYLST
jgi:branched-chain amino acid transport system ATP-binding protein